MRAFSGAILVIVLTAAVPAAAQSGAPGVAPPRSAAPADDGQWTMPAKNFASTRYSELSEINSENVAGLQVAFAFSTGVPKGQEAAPLVVDGVMYVLTPFPNKLYALDLTKPGAPLKWMHEPNPDLASQGVACCDVVARGPALANGRIFYNTLDGHTLALDAASGKLVWDSKIGDINIGETITMAPLVVKNKVLVGNSGGEYGVRGWLAALDADDGHIVWKAYSTGPDQDVLIGPNFKPFYKQDQGSDLGVTTWPPDHWKMGGGGVWGWISYDPDLDLIYYGTANPGPWNSDSRPGDNKWTAGIFAREPDTGQAKWFYQWSPHDLYDHDGVNENVLLDMEWNGSPRKTLVHPERNGYVYVLDRATGEVLSAEPFGYVNASKGVDLKTGRLIENEEKHPQMNKVVRFICPTAAGAKDWSPSAFSPRTGLLYIPHNNLCMDHQNSEVGYIAGTPYVGAEVRMTPGPGGNRGVFTAWDVAHAKAAWEVKEDLPVWSGALVTAGDIVFYGTLEGWFKALDARDGRLLWRFKTSSGIIGQPIAYRGPDGHEYVAVLSGVGGWVGAIVDNDLDPRDGTAALGFVNAVKDLKSITTPGDTLYVFRLP